MTNRAAMLLGMLMALLTVPGTAMPQPVEIRAALPSATLAGSSHFTHWGFDIYDVSLWVEPGFNPAEYDRHVFALDLSYLRDFSNLDITKRSMDEMRRRAHVTPAQSKAWEAALREAFPGIRRGDRITGINQPGAGALFLTNGKQTGAIRDPVFARLFFGIWLAEKTSEPALRRALLARVASP